MRRIPCLPLALAAFLAAPAAVPAAWSGHLDPVRDAVLEKGEEVGLGEKPRTREKRALAAALRRLDRAREGLLDDLRDLAPVCRRIDRAFPGDPLLDPALATAFAELRGECLVERAALLVWMGRTGSDRNEAVLARGIARVDALMQRSDSEEVRARRAARMRSAMRAVERTRRRLRIDLPRVDDPPFEGQAPDFTLLDANPASETAGEGVSPRDHLDRVTAWYFVRTT